MSINVLRSLCAPPHVQDYDLQQKLKPMMQGMVPLPSICSPDFIAANQSERANNVLRGTKQEQMDKVYGMVHSLLRMHLCG